MELVKWDVIKTETVLLILHEPDFKNNLINKQTYQGYDTLIFKYIPCSHFYHEVAKLL